MGDDCHTGYEKCDECGRPRCPRCGRCKGRIPGSAPGTWRFYCRSWRCSVAKKIRRLVGSPYTKADTPEADA